MAPRLLALALIGLLAAAPARADEAFDAALAAYDRGDFAAAAQGFERLAEAGNADAMTNLGLMYLHGRSVARDELQALALFSQAGAAGSPHALFNLAGMYRDGTGVTQDYRQAAELLRAAAEAGHAESMTALAIFHRRG
ncbi:MAG: sel1 repeat family protein, partial [Rhodospirillaceae bacterium]|nr:sel1 repeat family protein [Rhodospirillaceae bacterium]